MSSYTAIDLSQLPPPEIVEQPPFETIYQSMKATLEDYDPELFAAANTEPVVEVAERVKEESGDTWFRVPMVTEKDMLTQLESDPATKILGICAYRECLLRQRVNEAIQGVMLAYAHGADLDQHGANYGLSRLVTAVGDPDAIPPVAPVFETDIEFRRRILQVFSTQSVTGPTTAYINHAMREDSELKDVAVANPEPGKVRITIMGQQGDGTVSAERVDKVEAKLRSDDIRPLTDYVYAQSVSIVSYRITARLALLDGPDSELVRQDAVKRINDYIGEQHKIGRDITLSGLYAALHTSGVQNVVIHEPAADVVTTDEQAPWCTSVNVATSEEQLLQMMGIQDGSFKDPLRTFVHQQWPVLWGTDI